MSAGDATVVPAESGRLPGLDGLRGLAILAVLFHHLFVYSADGPVGARLAVIAEFMSHGVDLFFALSGFLIVRQLARSGSHPGFGRHFWVHRLAKIVPLYLSVVLIVFALLPPLFKATGHTEKLIWISAGGHKWPWYAFFCSNIRNALDGQFTNPALDVVWSLGIEVQFYVLVFFLASFIPTRRWTAVAVFAIALAIVCRAVERLLGLGWIPILVLTPGRLDAFALGALVAIAPQRLSRFPTFLIWIVLAAPLFLPWSRESSWVQIGGYTLVSLAAALAIERSSRPGFAGAGDRFLTQRWLTFLGKISYSIYLIHLPLRAVLRDYTLPKIRLLTTPGDFLRQGAYTVGGGLLCVLGGWLVWLLFEEPIRQVLVQRFADRGSLPQA